MAMGSGSIKVPKALRGREGTYSYGVDLGVLPSKDDCVRPPVKDNPWYPLPPMFMRLGYEEQGYWRVNACCIQETPRDLAIAYAFFFFNYLWPKEAAFLQDARKPPPFHYLMVHDLALYHFNAFAAPRHACKTTLIRALNLLLLLTRRGYRIGYLTSKQRKHREMVNSVRKQLGYNNLIKKDFGDPRPPKTGLAWNVDSIALPGPWNTSLDGMSLAGKERGWHGELLNLDDPERDADTDEVIPELVRRLDQRMRYVFMPMVEIAPEDLDNPEISKVGRGFNYFGTILGEGMVLNKIVTCEPGGPYDNWNRWKFETSSLGLFIWPERWGYRSTEVTRRAMGEDAFDSERQNRPGKSQVGILKIDPVYHTYHLDKTDEFLASPWDSESVIRWAVRGSSGPKWGALRAAEWLTTMTIGIVVDPADTTKADTSKLNDFTVCHVLGMDFDFNLWSLDIARGRFNTEEATEHLVRLALAWKPLFIAIERCGLYNRIADELMLRLRDTMLATVGWIPYPLPLGPFNKTADSKNARIDRTVWRWADNRIRFPWWRRNEDPYDQCWHEVENYTSDLSKLKNDDIIDTIGLTPYCFKGAGGRPLKANDWEGKTVEQLLIEGTFVTDAGEHLVDMLPSLGGLGDEALAALERYYGGFQGTQAKGKEAKQIRSRTLSILTV
jgi:hypothetical protein